jgi:hypothetical protein
MDTDSSYKALSHNRLIDAVKPELRAEFFHHYGDWFVTPYCDQHRQSFINTMIDGNGKWEMSQCCRDAKVRDSRTPGKFKEEFTGSTMVALNSKTYICIKDDEDLDRDFPLPKQSDGCNDSTQHLKHQQEKRELNRQKNSSKGLSKRTNTLTIRHYRSVLLNRKPKSGVNKGFVKKNNKLYTYHQTRNGLTYFYAKRKVLEDGVSTTHLDV